jgi:hypothetical protein
MRRENIKLSRKIWSGSLGLLDTVIRSLAGFGVHSSSSSTRYTPSLEYNFPPARSEAELTVKQRTDRLDESYNYESLGLNRVARATSMAMASLLPTISIMALYYIDNDLWRIGFIAMFSVLFTVCLSVFTAATRIEIFLASVGLASVQVVFIGNLLGSSIVPASRSTQKPTE